MGMNHSAHKLPRLYVDAPFAAGADIPLSADHTHYFKTVLRRQDGDSIRLFNGRDGEWLCTLRSLTKKGGVAQPVQRLRDQGAARMAVHLYVAPIKKARMDWVIEKSVELGVTDIHPVITQNTEIREINTDRVHQQMIEAAEQCERLDIPRLHPIQKLQAVTASAMLACIERDADAKSLVDIMPAQGPLAFLIGPEGGFTAEETTWIKRQPGWVPVALGPQILRAETAATLVLGAALLRG